MEQGKLYRIGEVAKLFRLSAGSLRHYETMGILPPAYVDPESGYRYYSTQQFECLNTIRYLRYLLINRRRFWQRKGGDHFDLRFLFWSLCFD